MADWHYLSLISVLSYGYSVGDTLVSSPTYFILLQYEKMYMHAAFNIEFWVMRLFLAGPHAKRTDKLVQKELSMKWVDW